MKQQLKRMSELRKERLELELFSVTHEAEQRSRLKEIANKQSQLTQIMKGGR